MTRKRLAKGKSDIKSDILFNLSKSSGMSGVRKASEVLPTPSPVAELDKFEDIDVTNNKILLQSFTAGISDSDMRKIEPYPQAPF